MGEMVAGGLFMFFALPMYSLGKSAWGAVSWSLFAGLLLTAAAARAMASSLGRLADPPSRLRVVARAAVGFAVIAAAFGAGAAYASSMTDLTHTYTYLRVPVVFGVLAGVGALACVRAPTGVPARVRAAVRLAAYAHGALGAAVYAGIAVLALHYFSTLSFGFR